ncbi:ATP-grasp domain-containing protein [Stutzerimonas nitrititolerans]|uniref:ATP-grasp domain-containing protein n=1 Tax=Stutzerimonas nitrititolerans TaxID=2482751 RepID=A0AA41WNZ8_9GAMM|nr:ATP-grasp domain-containing protein [Stutzerimonas nitrititolerans]MCO7546963.1 ATP-grasp domain-containing protein [Stutzerimonas nitrititolerans]
MSLNLLLTAAGTGTGYAYALAQSRWFPQIALFTADTSPAELVSASLFSRRHLVLPPSNAADYFGLLESVLLAHALDVYIPLIDLEVSAAAARREQLSARVACNGLDFCNAALAKSCYGDWLDVDGVRVPQLVRDEALQASGRIVAKRDGGFGGRATRVLDGPHQVAHYREEGWELYEYIDGDEFTVDCFPLTGSVLTSVRQRLEVKSGVCSKARILRDPLLDRLAAFLVERFALSEPFCFQTRRAQGVHYLIDINPRLGAGSAMSALNGTDFFAAHLAALVGEDPGEHLRPRFRECVVTRQYTEYLMDAVE